MLLSVRDLSAILRVPEGTVYRWIRDGGLPAREVRGHYRAHPVDLLEWLADHPVPVDPGALPTDDQNGSLPSLEAAIRAGGVYHELAGTSRQDALTVLATRLPKITGLPADDLRLLLLRRESVGSAYLQEGIAVPNPRHPLIHTTIPPMLAVAFPAEPIVWNGSGCTVRVVFALLTPTARDHLRLLGRLIFALHDPAFKAALAARAPAEQVLAAARDLEHVTAAARPAAAGLEAARR
ncbi:MAG: IIA-like nitrogen-regulatory protein PtsN [Gemmataceae bacterium]|nr:IIA-like nitrogen-regulatory protein PtsN [Gemmataceae bacterium]